MQKLLFLALIGFMAIQVNAQEEKKDGYVASYEGIELRTFYGECVHTAYYDRSTEEREACGGKPPAKPESAPALEPKTIIETVVITDEDVVLFNFDTAILTPHGIKVLTAFAAKTGKKNIVKITIEGYTDAIGTTEYNLKLSKERADSVKRFFVAHKFKADKMITHGYGEKHAKKSKACFIKYPRHQLHTNPHLIRCTAADRRVVIVVEHEKQVEKTTK